MQLNYKTYGTGDPIIILHGLFGMLDNWQTIAKALAVNNMVYLIDQRNHGKSPHTETHSYEEMAHDLHAFMEENWIYEATIIGHSMGGKTAMKFALEYPDFVEKLIVVDISPEQAKSGHNEVFEALFSLDLQKVENRKDAERKMMEKMKDLGIRQFLLKNLSRKKEGGYRWKMNLNVLYDQYDKILAPISGDNAFENPCLFIKGGKSTYIKNSSKSHIEAIFPNYSLETIEKAGHWVHAEAPNETIELISSFISKE